MDIKVRYYSKSGNTEKLAMAVAAAAGCTAKTVSEPISKQTDILFLGGAIYAGKINKELREFIVNLSADKVKKVVVFSTAATGDSMWSQVKSLLEEKGIAVADEFFHCRGKFLFANKNRPNDEDLNNAVAFVQKFTS